MKVSAYGSGVVLSLWLSWGLMGLAATPPVPAKAVTKPSPKPVAAAKKPTPPAASKPKTPLTGSVSKVQPTLYKAPDLVNASSKAFDLLHTVPFEVSGYTSGRALPAKFTSADEVLGFLKPENPLLVHMEALRRSYHDLSTEEKLKVISTLHQRYQAVETDVLRFFDHGYAQLVYRENKTGLFFLRKANDALKTQFTSLAYALAQADIDINQEDAAPDKMTVRKLDVTYKLGDAVTRDVKNHMPGFWPSFVRVIQKIQPLAAYADYGDTDFSLEYVPYGNNQSSNVAKLEASAAIASEACQLQKLAHPPNWGQLYTARNFSVTGQPLSVNFFSTATPSRYDVLVLNPQQQVLAEFPSSVAPYIVEDLDGDGVFELVVREYKTQPLSPVRVYRYQQCRFHLDDTVSAYFK